jgi:hypothetical protein
VGEIIKVQSGREKTQPTEVGTMMFRSEVWIRMKNLPHREDQPPVVVYVHTVEAGFNEEGFFEVRHDPASGVKRCTKCNDVASEPRDKTVYDYDVSFPDDVIEETLTDEELRLDDQEDLELSRSPFRRRDSYEDLCSVHGDYY